MSTFKNFGQE